MLVSLIDPDLLCYDVEEWREDDTLCLARFQALGLHRDHTAKFRLKLAMSQSFLALIYHLFPWNESYRDIPELRDLRQFVLQDLQMLTVFVEGEPWGRVVLQPAGVACQCVRRDDVAMSWDHLLHACVVQASTQMDPQLATWRSPCAVSAGGEVSLTFDNESGGGDSICCSLPLVYDEHSWAVQLNTQDWWPDLQTCVRLCFLTNPSIRNYTSVREVPIPFECTPSFLESLERYCVETSLRKALIEALTKKVYGLVNPGLGDEELTGAHGTRRFRVTDFWRIHYRHEAEHILLEEFGPHGIGGVD